MNSKTSLCLAMTTMFLTACLDSPEDPDVGHTEQESLAVTRANFGQACHVSRAGVSFGVVTVAGWCCGVSTCTDKQACGVELGKVIETCADCSRNGCDAGWIRPADMSPDVRISTGSGVKIVNDEQGYTIPFTPVHQ